MKSMMLVALASVAVSIGGATARADIAWRFDDDCTYVERDYLKKAVLPKAESRMMYAYEYTVDVTLGKANPAYILEWFTGTDPAVYAAYLPTILSGSHALASMVANSALMALQCHSNDPQCFADKDGDGIDDVFYSAWTHLDQRPYIHLCDEFWTGPEVRSDIIVHELAHIVLGAEDINGDVSAAHNFAGTQSALENAANWEYYTASAGWYYTPGCSVGGRGKGGITSALIVGLAWALARRRRRPLAVTLLALVGVAGALAGTAAADEGPVNCRATIDGDPAEGQVIVDIENRGERPIAFNAWKSPFVPNRFEPPAWLRVTGRNGERVARLPDGVFRTLVDPGSLIGVRSGEKLTTPVVSLGRFYDLPREGYSVDVVFSYRLVDDEPEPTVDYELRFLMEILEKLRDGSAPIDAPASYLARCRVDAAPR